MLKRDQVLRLVAVSPLHEGVSSFFATKESQGPSANTLRIYHKELLCFHDYLQDGGAHHLPDIPSGTPCRCPPQVARTRNTVSLGQCSESCADGASSGTDPPLSTGYDVQFPEVAERPLQPVPFSNTRPCSTRPDAARSPVMVTERCCSTR